jgi:DNA-binding NarL/FixJ family response regulator
MNPPPPQSQTQQPVQQEPLSPREKQVAALIAFAFTDQQIAAALFITPQTVKTHIGSILSKLNLSNRTAICRWVLVNHYEGTGNIILFGNVFLG